MMAVWSFFELVRHLFSDLPHCPLHHSTHKLSCGSPPTLPLHNTSPHFRSSALASKATGFPIAKMAAKLAVGYTLDQIANDITQKTPASFEPSIDYVVTKVPKFNFEKFPGGFGMVWVAMLSAPRAHLYLFNLLPFMFPRDAGSKAELGTMMKSVGEVMAIGRTWIESLQKAMRGMEAGLDGWDLPANYKRLTKDQVGVGAEGAEVWERRVWRCVGGTCRPTAGICPRTRWLWEPR